MTFLMGTKKNSIYGHKLGCSALALLTICWPVQTWPDDGAPFSARVVRVTGAVRCSIDGRPWQTLKADDLIKAGTVVQTAKTKATVDIQLGTGGSADANFVRLFENSGLAIKKLVSKGSGNDRVEEVELNLLSGQILGVVNKTAAASKCDVSFPNGIASVRADLADSKGTVYVLNSSGVVKVLAGKIGIVLVSDNPAAQMVSAEEQFDPATGQITRLPPDAPERKLYHF